MLIQCREQAPQANPHCAEVCDFINFQLGIQLATLPQNLPRLIRCNGVHAAAEADELYQVHIRLGAAVLRRRVQPGVVGPLVQHRGLKGLRQLGDGILRHHRRAELGDEGVDAVIYLYIPNICSSLICGDLPFLA